MLWPGNSSDADPQQTVIAVRSVLGMTACQIVILSAKTQMPTIAQLQAREESPQKRKVCGQGYSSDIDTHWAVSTVRAVLKMTE